MLVCFLCLVFRCSRGPGRDGMGRAPWPLERVGTTAPRAGPSSKDASVSGLCFFFKEEEKKLKKARRQQHPVPPGPLAGCPRGVCLGAHPLQVRGSQPTGPEGAPQAGGGGPDPPDGEPAVLGGGAGRPRFFVCFLGGERARSRKDRKC